VIVPATTQTPKAIIPAEIRNESAVSMIGPLSSSTAGRHRLHAGADVTREGGAAGRDRLRPAAPAAQNRDAIRGSQAAYRTRPKVNESNEPELRSKGKDLMQAAVAQSAAVARFPAKRAPTTPARRGRAAQLARKPPVRAWRSVTLLCIQPGA
jgi:hypothetical protein